jgi:hypothetical protein
MFRAHNFSKKSKLGTGGRTRTVTAFKSRGILSQICVVIVFFIFLLKYEI